MPEKYYFDTCIWRDHYENRFGTGGRPLGEIATRAFLKLMKENKPILFSEFNVGEMTRDYPEQEINNMLNLLFKAGKIKRVVITKSDVEEAKKLSRERGVSFGDCLHAVLARNSNAILITQNVKDFEQLADIVDFRKPEHI